LPTPFIIIDSISPCGLFKPAQSDCYSGTAFNGQLIRLIRAAKQRPQSLCIAIKAFFHAPIPHCSFTGFWRGQGWAIPMGSVMVNAGRRAFEVGRILQDRAIIELAA
jgi:hypothetical protein